jgi:hypothetical protein
MESGMVFLSEMAPTGQIGRAGAARNAYTSAAQNGLERILR